MVVGRSVTDILRGGRAPDRPARMRPPGTDRNQNGRMSATTELNDLLGELAGDGGPVLRELARLNASALQDSGLDERTALLVRFAALVCLDASPQSYLVHLGLASEAGVGAATIQAVLVELAPLVGSARVVAAVDTVRRTVQVTGQG